MRRLLSILILFFLATNTTFATVFFTVTRHTNTTFTTTQFDNAMTDVNQRLRIDSDRCSDVPCTADFFRSGSIGVFGTASDGLDIITTDSQLNDVMSIDTHRIKVVTVLDYCAGTFNPSIIGCGLCDGFGFVVESGVPSDTYVHEYGHNVLGCGHREDCTGNIMYHSTNGTNDSVNAAECSGFSGKVNVELCGNVFDGAGGPLTETAGPYWVTCNVTVPGGQTLTIDSGTEIQFKHGNKITVDGLLNGGGTTKRILMFSNSSGYPSMKIDSDVKMQSSGEILLH